MMQDRKPWQIVFSILFAALVTVLLPACVAPEGKDASSAAPSSAPETSGVSSDASASSEPGQLYVFTDSLGNTVTLPQPPQRVVAMIGSYAETWVLAGGQLTGVTQDAYDEREMQLPDTVVNLGSIKTPDVEQLLALEPDFVLLSADTDGQLKLAQTLSQSGIPAAYFRVDTFEDYLSMLKICTDLTGREDLYRQNGTDIAGRIEAVRRAVADQPAPSVLYLRAFSTGVKAKGEDSLAGAMIKDLGANNLVDLHPSLLEDLSMEEIIAEDPDFILVTTMGSDSQAALDTLRETMAQNPAWAELSAMQNGRFVVLPKNLFHYKPNAKWGESYETLAKILYGLEG